ncbi:hypothetical protein EYV94_08930 [Puteibacter caeruleilacunae]|nr:hypothetical protein EYV94_08930 [Puteibacter caeruleilacunae]
MKFVKVLCLLLLVISACTNKQGTKAVVYSENSNALEIKHAQLFSVKQHLGYQLLELTNPWIEGQYMGRYLLVPRDKKAPLDLPQDIQVVKIPVQKVASMSNTNIGFLDILGSTNVICATTIPNSVYHQEVWKRYNNGEVKDLGNDLKPDTERLVACEPEILLKSGYNQSLTQDQQLKATGIPLVYNIEWMEQSVLARAEWVKVLGLLVGKEKEAIKVFDKICNDYNNYIQLAKQVKEKPKTMLGSNYKGTWYIAGNESYTSRLVRQAGGAYNIPGDKSQGSIPVGFENVVEYMADANFWLDAKTQSITELTSQDERYELFNCVKTGNVYNRMNRVNERYANDYYESGVVRPDLILADFIKIIHPELLPEYSLYYHKKLSK